MELSDTILEAANRRGAAKKASFPAVLAVRYDRRIARIVISLASGLDIAFAPRDVQGFENAHPAELVDAEISPSGFGVYFPKIDADIYIPALIEGFLGSKRWIAAQNGRAGGSASTPLLLRRARPRGKMGSWAGGPSRQKRWPSRSSKAVLTSCNLKRPFR